MKGNNKFPWLKYYEKYSSIKSDNISIYDEFKSNALKCKDKVACEYFGKVLTYEELLSKIDESANAFINIGVKKGDYVTICLPNTIEAIISIYSLNKIGAISNIVHPLSSEEDIKKQMRLVDSKYLLVADYILNKTTNLKEELNLKKIIFLPVIQLFNKVNILKYSLSIHTKKFKILDQDIITYANFVSKGKQINDIKIKYKKDDIAVILYSNSMSNNPKGIALTNENLNSVVTSEKTVNKNINKRTIISSIPFYNSYGLSSVFHTTLSSGGVLYIIPSLNIKKIDKYIYKFKPNTLVLTPTMFDIVLKSKTLKKEDLSYINQIISTGEYLSKEHYNKINKFIEKHNISTQLDVTYGLTECASKVSSTVLLDVKNDNIGIPTYNTYVKICKPNTIEECKYNEEGEICVYSPSIMKGYINNDTETKKVLKKHHDGKTWLHTRDIAYMDTDGKIFFKSKMKRMITSAGHNIYPKQIEDIIKKHKYVDTCIIVGVPHPYKKEVVKAYIVLKKNIVLTAEVKKNIKEYCEKNIASYALPYAYGYRKELPKNKIGKVAYQELINEFDEEESL